MATERELREQEERAEQFYEDAQNPYSWKNGKWFRSTVSLLSVMAVIVM